jgi:hypothetical protein
MGAFSAGAARWRSAQSLSFSPIADRAEPFSWWRWPRRAGPRPLRTTRGSGPLGRAAPIARTLRGASQGNQRRPTGRFFVEEALALSPAAAGAPYALATRPARTRCRNSTAVPGRSPCTVGITFPTVAKVVGWLAQSVRLLLRTRMRATAASWAPADGFRRQRICGAEVEISGLHDASESRAARPHSSRLPRARGAYLAIDQGQRSAARQGFLRASPHGPKPSRR